MKQKQKEVSLQREEIKAVKLFLWLFYGTYIGYEFFYYVFSAYYKTPFGIHNLGKALGLFHYFIIVSLLFGAMYLIKKEKPWIVKYLYFFGYSILEMINNFIIFTGNSIEFYNGNVVEILFILFAPIFINKRYFYVVTIGLITQYI